MFKTYRPETVDDLLTILDQDTCHIFAGGTDLMIRKRQWQGAERKFTMSVAYINHLSTLRGIQTLDATYEIGALTTQTEIANSDLPEYLKVPYSLMATPAIRNVATVGGNIVNAASVADSLPVLYALDARLQLESVEGIRILNVKDFVLGKYKTLRKTNELLSKVIIPKYDASDFYYRKVGQRKASILSKVSVFGVRKKGDIRLAIGAVNDTVIRDDELESLLVDTKDIEGVLRKYELLMKGKDDKRSTKRYREHVAINLLRDYLKEVVDEL